MSDGDDGRHAPYLGSVFVDATDRNADWPKTATLDAGLATEEEFRASMLSGGITPEHLRRMAIFSEQNRRRYPWLDRLAGLDG